MKQVVGCALFIGLLAGAGIIFLKQAQLSSEKAPVFKEDTRRGASQRYVRAMAEGDLATMQKYAHDNIKDRCQELIDQFSGRVSGPVDSLTAVYPDGEDPDRVMIRVNHRVIVDCWVRKVGGEYLVRECRF